MEEATQAIVFFWLAGLFVVVGGMLAFFSKVQGQRRLGGALFGLGLLSLMLTPWTLPFSPSSAFGHLLGSLVGPGVLLGFGLYQIAFSGHVPVGRLSRTDRTVGIVMVVVGVLWLEAMHWWVLTPTYPAEVNRYWYIFWPTMLLGVLTLSSAAYVLVGLVGQQRQQEQRLMLVTSALAIVLMVLGAMFNGPSVDHQRFATELIFAAADIFGAMVGASVAILLFAVVLTVYESQQPAPQRLAPPTEQQLEQASQIIAQHVGGESEDE